ncbi:MAG TPA: prepilin-type N-terminal cleavage/methylation domain-containing protein [Tepidisphaeraceae bacterium]|nr:prepilin-type N-terminal cleavage/methylation domain-containing protein [Tepidisphaeraceae bacterium]
MRHVILRDCARQSAREGFTLVELLVTVLCVAIAAFIVLPTVSDNSGERVRGAAQILVADLEYAQSRSMSQGDDPGKRCLLVIDPDRAGYRITTRSDPTAAVTNKIGGDPYVTRFGSGRASSLVNVTVGSYSLGGDQQLGFGALGQLDQPSTATIQLVCGTRSLAITLDPTTGEITTGPLQ